MGQLFRLAGRARKNAAPRKTPEPLGASAFYCMRCAADRFLLYPEGLVQCAACGAQMENLAIADCAPAEGA